MSFDLKILDGDLKIGNDGDLQQVNNTEKLSQDILKMISTPLGGNVFFPWYGSPVTNILIGSALDTKFLYEASKNQITTSLNRLQELQRVQSQSYQKTTPSEMIGAVKDILLERNQSDPRYFRLIITVLNKAFTDVSAELDVTL